MTTSEPVIEVSGLRKSYGSTIVLDGVDFTVRRGEIFALLGPNGAGKTTTVNILTTLQKADSGAATIGGHDVAREPVLARAELSLTGQFAAVDGFQTGEENLLMMCRLAHLDGRSARRRTAELLDQFDLIEPARRRVATYSGGLRRRLDLAISLIANPPVVFLDEPTTGLDPRSRSQLWDVVRRLADAGTTIVLTTQYLEEADRLADRIAVIDAGRIVAAGTAAELKSDLGGDRVELVFDGEESFAAACLVDFGDEAEFDADGTSVRVPTTDAVQTTRQLLAIADRAGLAITTISIAGPTLDDVFLAITGAATTPERTQSTEHSEAAA